MALDVQGLDGDGSRGLVEEVAKVLAAEGQLIHLQMPSDKQWKQACIHMYSLHVFTRQTRFQT